MPTFDPDTWYARPGWGFVHRMKTDATQEFLGRHYGVTLCGRSARADVMPDQSRVDLCGQCLRRSGGAS